MKTRFIFFFITMMATSLLLQPVAQAQKPSKFGATPEDSLNCIMNLSLYTEFYKQWKNSNYKNTSVKDAYGPWRKVFTICPGIRLSTYVDGARMLSHFIKIEKDETRKNAYIDTLMMLYDRRIEYFDKEGFVLGRKGVDLYTLRNKDFEKAYDILYRSVELDGDQSSPDVLVFLMRASKKMVEESKASEDIIFDNYDICSKIIESNLEASAGDDRSTANWENVKSNIDLIFEPFAHCEAIINIYSKKFKENPEDLKMLKKLTRLLDKKKCTEDPLYFQATVKLYELEPSPESAFLIGKMYLKNLEYSKAAEYLKEGEKLNDSDDRADSYLFLAECYRNLNNFSLARTYALKSIGERPDNGNPYIMIGDMYAASNKMCGSNDLEKKAVYWVAVDKYMRARQVDPEVAEVANARIRAYSVYFPQTEEIFFHNLHEGDEFTVDCWINEKTLVRAATSN